jgi:defect-in-organelle-trafficking protein DotB
MLNMVVSQRLLPNVGGGVVPCREYLVLGKAEHNILMDSVFENWPSVVRQFMDDKAIKGQSFETATRHLLLQGLITAETAAHPFPSN